MDSPDAQIFLLTGASVAVPEAIAYAYTRRRPCVVLGATADTGPGEVAVTDPVRP
ncbi:hypothetical protein [Rhodococcus sp. ACT016]|uniref:hypothetical protein n=1 Tax=Rhodococcus sp. ACT016 TaxID=3134808 RepID=UPI003D27B53F